LAAIAAIAGCAPAAPPPDSGEIPVEQAARFDLSKCQVLEPGLYRCSGTDTPVCDPDFARTSVRCIKVTHNGKILEIPPQ
jgi:hypothetical protein